MIDKNETVSKINRIYTDANLFKQRYVKQWRLNDAFIKGYQNVAFRPYTNQLYVPVAPKKRVRIIENHMQEMYLNLLSILTAGRPSVFCAPATGEPEDIADARAQQQLADFLWDDLKLSKLIVEAVAHGILSDRMILKVYWDVNKGDDIQVPKDAEEIAKLIDNLVNSEKIDIVQGLPEEAFYKTTRSGYVSCYAVSPHSFFVEPHVKSWEEVRRCIETHFYHIDDAREIWGDKIQGNIFQEELYTNVENLQDSFGFTYKQNVPREESDMVMVKEYYELPTKKHKNGYWCIVINNEILEESEHCPELPYVSEQLVHDGDSFWGEINKVATAIPFQMELNKTLSQIIEHKNMNISPPKYFESGGGIDPENFDDAPGARQMVHNLQKLPRAEEIQPINPQVYALPDQYRVIIENLFGIHGITKGRMEGNISSGRAFAFYAEKDQQKFSHPATNIENLYQSVAIRLMKLWKNHMPMDKTITVMGKDLSWESFKFKANQVKSFNVFVRPYSMMMSNKAMQNDLIIQLMGMGAVDPEMGTKLLEFGNAQLLFGERDADSAWAKRENLLMLNGIAPQVHWWEDHASHFKVVTDFMKTADYHALPDEIKPLFESHAKAHAQYMQQAMQQMAGAQGGVPPTGGNGTKPTPEQGYDIGVAQGKTTVDQGEEAVLRQKAGLT